LTPQTHLSHDGFRRLTKALLLSNLKPCEVPFFHIYQFDQGSWVSQANTIVITGSKMNLAMQVIFKPMIERLEDQKRSRHKTLKLIKK
jgi:phosphoribulokinase